MKTKTLLNGCVCLITVLSMATMTACSDEEENNDPVGKKLVSKIEVSVLGNPIFTRTFSYDTNGRIIKDIIGGEDPDDTHTINYSYTDDTHLTMTVAEEESTANCILEDGRPISVDYSDDDEFIRLDYDGAFLKSVHIEDPAYHSVDRYDYTWSEGNIIKVVNTEGTESYTFNFKYLEKENKMNYNIWDINGAYGGSLFAFALGLEMLNSRHLLSSVQWKNYSGRVETSTFSDYEFDSEGYPIQFNNHQDFEDGWAETVVWKIEYTYVPSH